MKPSHLPPHLAAALPLGPSRNQLTAYGLTLIFVLLPFFLVLPGLFVIFSERELIAKLEAENESLSFQGLSDLELRRRVQKIARTQGFHLATQDVIVQLPVTEGFSEEQTPRIGYTLVMKLPVLWIFDFEIVAVRDIDLNSRL